MISIVGCGILRIKFINTWHVHWQLDDLQESYISSLILTNSVAVALSIKSLTRYTVWTQDLSFNPLRALALVVVLQTKITAENHQSISIHFTYVYEGPMSHRLPFPSLRHIFRMHYYAVFIFINRDGVFSRSGTFVTSAITTIKCQFITVYVCFAPMCFAHWNVQPYVLKC